MTSKKKLNKKYVMVAVDPETRDILNFIRKGTGKPTAEFLKEFCSTLMQLVARYDVNKFNLELEYSLVPNPAIIIRSTGASTFVIASLDERAKAKLRREMLERGIRHSLGTSKGRFYFR